MNTYQLQRKILSTPTLNMTEKLIGMTYALHLNIKAGTIRVKQATIARECGCTDRTVRGAVAKLVDAGIFKQVRTGRTSVLRIACKNNCNMKSDGSYVPVRAEATFRSAKHKRLKIQDDVIDDPSRKVFNPLTAMPWEFDKAMTTRAEEEDKRWRDRL